jgi:hypothetical protein
VWGVLGEGQPEGSGHSRSFGRRPSGCCRGLGPPPCPCGLFVVAGAGMGSTLGVGGRLALSVAAPVGSRASALGWWVSGGVGG